MRGSLDRFIIVESTVVMAVNALILIEVIALRIVVIGDGSIFIRTHLIIHTPVGLAYHDDEITRSYPH